MTRPPHPSARAERYTCLAPGAYPGKACGGMLGDAEPGLHFLTFSTRLPAYDGVTRVLLCRSCKRWSLYRPADERAA